MDSQRNPQKSPLFCMGNAEFLKGFLVKLHNANDLESVLDTVLEVVVHEMGFDFGIISLVNTKFQTIEIKRSLGKEDFKIPDEWMQTSRVSLNSDNILADIIRHNQSKIVEQSDDRGNKSILDRVLGLRLTRVYVPIKNSSGTIIGIVEAGTLRKTLLIDDELLNSFEKFAALAASEIENSISLRELKRQNNELRALRRIGESIAEAQSPKDIALAIFNELRKDDFIIVRNFFFALYDQSNHSIEFLYAVDHGNIVDWKKRDNGNGLTEYVIRNRSPLLLDDDIEQWMSNNNVGKIGDIPKTWLGAPLNLREQILGVIAVQDYEEEGIYDLGHLEFISTIASQAAVGVGKANALSESKALIESSPIAIVATDWLGNITTFNRAAEQLLGYDRKIILGSPESSLYEDGNITLKRIHRILTNSPRSISGEEVILLSKSGEKIPAFWAEAKLLDDTPRDLGRVGFLSDRRPLMDLEQRINLLGEMIEQLHQTEDIEQIADHIVVSAQQIFQADAVALFSRDQKQLSLTSELGYEDLQPTNISIDLNTAIGVAVSQDRTVVVENFDKSQLRSVHARAKSGVASPLDVGQDVMGVLEVVSFTESRFQESDSRVLQMLQSVARAGAFAMRNAQLKTQRDENLQAMVNAERAAATGQMATLVIHEIKNSLNSMGLAITNLAQDVTRASEFSLKGSVLQRTKVAEEEILRLSKLIESLRSYSRAPHSVMASFYLNNVVRRTVELLTIGRNRKLTVDLELDPSLSTPVSDNGGNPVIGDERAILQVIVNLVRNAIDATGERGKIRLRTKFHRDTNLAEFRVIDYGIGIPDENRSKIFQPRFTTKEDGTGLGLFVAKRIVEEQHGGDLDFTSTVGKGSQFWFLVPLE